MDECQNVSQEFEELEKLCSETLNAMGQSESKKSKKISGPETKGTAMSFGFKKKISSTSNKKNTTANINNNNIFANKDQESDKYDQQTATIITNHGVVKNDNNNLMITGDDNGNTGYESSNDKETTGRSTPRLQPAKRDQITGVVGRSNRFGFRQNTVRPASVGLTPKINDFDNVNNNTVTPSTDQVDKKRSKSASATSRTNTQIQVNQQPQVRFNPKTTNFTYQQQQQQQQLSRNIPLEMKSRPEPALEEKYAVVRTDMHTNSIIRPTPVSVSRYTLHTTSLPKPQYPVPVSLTSANMGANRMQSTNQRIGNAMDPKGAKQAANLNRKGGLVGRDESYDSGIASHESFSSNEHQQAMDMKRPRSRGRTIEMVMSGRHKFEIRESNAFNEFTDDHIVPLALPKLPSAFNNERQEIVVGGLVRSTNSNISFDSDNNNMATSSDSRNNNYRQDSITSTSEAESCEEEKLTIDNNSSEKSLKGAIIKDYQLNSKSSSPGSSRASWCNAGESLAVKDCSSISLSSSDEERKKLVSSDNQMKMDEEEDLSTVTITADHTSYLNSSPSKSSPQKSGINDAFVRDPKTVTITRKEFLIQMDEFKFAEMAEAIKDSKLLDDETSPTDSLVSSTTDSDDIGLKKKDKDKDNDKDEVSSKQDDIKEKDLEDITPELIDMISPLTPGTPTHASNSFSLSHEGQDFLIDDEIADQPALVFDENTQNNASQSEYIHSNQINATSETTTTPTLKDMSIDSHGSLKSSKKHSLFNQLQHFSPSVKRNKKKSLTRTESLDTLSPCDSIASDDLMGDFDLNSSLDSIDRPAGGSFNSFNNSARHSVDELQIISEMESKEHDMIRDWNSLLKIRTRQTSSRENITSQLPARATRLLNRRQQNNSNSPLSLNGSESPRSLDSLHSRTTPSSKTSLKDHLKQRQQNNLQNNLLNSSSEDLLVDKSLRNSMLQDVVHFKKQLVHLRRILQEDEENLMRTDTLNPFEANGHLFTNHVNGTAENTESNTQSDKDKKDDENNVTLTNEQLIMLEDQRQELADLRRQVVYLQSQMDDKDRTIKIQQNMLEKLELERAKILETSKTPAPVQLDYKDVSNAATQTDRLRPASMGQDTITSQNESLNGTTTTKNQPNEEIKIKTSKPNDLSNNAKLPSIILKVNDNGKIPTITIKPLLPKSKTQISSIYTKLSSIKPTTTTITTTSTANTETTATSQPLKNVTSTSTANSNKISSIPNFSNKTVKTTQIGNVFPTVKYINGNTKTKKPEISPAKSKTSQLVKPQIVLNNPIKNGKSLMKRSESDGNSQSSLSSSNSSLSANQDIIELKNEYNSVKIGGRNGISKC